MLVTEYISRDFIPPKLNQTVGHCLNLITEFNLTHLPVFEGLNFVGNINKETLEEHPVKMVISELRDLFESFYLTENSSLLDALQQYQNHEANILPVLTTEFRFLGLLLLDDVILGFSQMPFISEPGSIMVVEVSQKRFSVSEIANIAESNNARIIGLFVTGYHDDKARITIKLIADSLTSVGETFERFDYDVLYKFFNDEKEDLMKDRFKQLMKYLDV